MPMNDPHKEFMASDGWAEWLERETLPWVQTFDLGDDVLEVGSGPGRSTDLLRSLAPRVTAVEVDPELAAGLAQRLAGTNVEVIEADGTDLPLPDDRFSSAATFGMLHHVPSPAQQDTVFAQVHRVLRPGGVYLATDSLDTEGTRAFHEGDTFTVMAPETLPARLAAAGFADVRVEQTDFELRFSAVKAGATGA